MNNGTRAHDPQPDLNHRGRLMSEHSIRFDGRYYLLNGSRYERLADALARARSLASLLATGAGLYPR